MKENVLELNHQKRDIKGENKMWTAEKMMDNVINKYGFESEVTIRFCEKAKLFNNFELSSFELIYFYQKAMEE